jgi:carbamoyl-phosphate synthase large subunit
MIRVAYTLGGRGGGVAYNEYELDEIAQRGLAISMTRQLLIEEYIGEWKQIEYEIMRDRAGNSLTVCNMENVLSMRIHTGDNIVIAPSQTLNNREYHLLRTAALRAAEVCGIVGECNIQFGLHNSSERYTAIEINARLSRSSALASKATGYPLAYMAAKLALGYLMSELFNKVTGVTTACFEPSLDYVVLKHPRWDLKKFERVSRGISTQMKSVGEVMAIGRTFEEVLQKSIRMLDIGKPGLVANSAKEEIPNNMELLEGELTHPTDEIMFRLAEAIKAGMPLEQVQKLAVVDKWFLSKIQNIVNIEKELRKSKKPSAELIAKAKKFGFSDRQIANCTGTTEGEARESRIKNGIVPIIKQIDTLGAEWPAKTNYLYSTYNGDNNDIVFEKTTKVIVLGGGTYRIGSSVEFDWGTMNMVWALKEHGFKEVIVVNCNPETVSTDYDMSDKLYFEELTLERVLDIYEKEKPEGIVTCVGGQIPNNLAPKLAQVGVKILGTHPDSIDSAEDRSKFSKLLDELGIPQPPWRAFTSIDDAYSFADKVGYPVLVRPSYVLSGAAMRVIWSSNQLEHYLEAAAKVSPEYPVVISKFMLDAKEAEVDAVSDGTNVYIGAVIEHVEKAGVHSGDAVMCIPPRSLEPSEEALIIDYTNKIAKELKIKGPFNIQFLVKGGKVYIIECNLRASRSMPFVSKLTGVNLMTISAKAVLGEAIESSYHNYRKIQRVGVKVPQFSFMQLTGADPNLGVEMQSTGEVACFGKNFNDAYMKALVAAGYQIPRKNGNILITVGGEDLKKQILPIAKELHNQGFKIYATEQTADFLAKNGVDSIALYKIGESSRKPNLEDYLVAGQLDLIINLPLKVPSENTAQIMEDEYIIRRKAVELGIPVLTTLEGAIAFTEGLSWLRENSLTLEATA